MRKRFFSLLLIFTFLLHMFTQGIPNAEAAIETPDFGWSLGKYDAATNEYHIGASVTWWNGRKYWTDGPWSIYIDGVRQGSVINFSDVLLTADNGYPLVGSSQWDKWISIFGGDNAFVKGQLNSAYLGNSWEISTPQGPVTFANLAKISELSGGKGGAFDTKQMSSIYYKTPNPTSSLTVDKTAIKAGETVIFTIKANTQNYYYQFVNISFAGAGQTYINNKRYDGPATTITQAVTINTQGTYTFNLLVKDGVMRKASTKQVTIAVGPADQPAPTPPDQPPTEQPPPDQPPPDQLPPDQPSPAPANQPPEARFDWPVTAVEGEPVTVTENSFDPDGQIMSWDWQLSPVTDANKTLQQGGGKVTFPNTGTYSLTLTVTDNGGLTDSLTKSIIVTPATPVAEIKVTGTRKENRKVILDSSQSFAPSFAPIDHTRDEWAIEPLIGGTANDIKLGTRTGSTQEVLFKKEGTYRAKLRVHNSKGASPWTTYELIIAPDVPPTANFLVSTVLYRNPGDGNIASIQLKDQSYSVDADLIQQRVWRYRFDANNNGTFSDDAVQVLDSGNNTTPTLRTNKVGKYLFELDVIENFGQDTIPSFVSWLDYKSANTGVKPLAEKTVEVRNIAPATTVGTAVRPKVDIVFVHGNLADYSTRFASMIDNLETIVGNKLKARGMDYAFYNTTSQFSGINAYSQIHDENTQAALGWGRYIGDSTGDGNPLPWWVRDRVVDFGRTISRDSISSSWTNFLAWEGTYILAVSLDGANWHDVTSWTVGDGGYDDWRKNRYVTKDMFPIPLFRYAKLYPKSRHDNWMALFRFKHSITIDDSAKSYLQPIQAEALKPYRAGATKFLVNFTEELYRDTAAYPTSSTAASVNNAGAHLVVFGNGASLNDTQQLINQTWKKALFDTTWDMAAPLDKLADYIIEQTPVNYTTDTKYLLLGDALLNFNPTYSDYENDPKMAENWVHIHDPGFLDNNSGYVWFHNTPLSAPVASFDLAGKYDIAFKAQDDPTAGDNLFGNYRLWSHSVPATVIIHRRPIASFTYSLIQGRSLTFTNTSYDPDFQYRRGDKGVMENVWEWRKSASGTWNSGLPTIWPEAGDYVFRLRVKDIYGVWSDPYEKTISLTVPITNKPPVPDFTWSDPVYNNTKVQFTNHSQDPDGDNLTYTWYKRPAGGAWTQFSTAVNPSYVIGPQGTYEIGLVVNDGTETAVKTKNLVVQNRAPNANFTWAPNPAFEGDSVNLTGSTTEPDGDTVTYNWSVRTPSGTIKAYNTANVKLGVVQAGTYQVSLTVTDSFGSSNTITKNVLIRSLGVTGYVRHTPQWAQNRIKYNQSKTGTDDSPRPYNYFFAGEAFVLEADTTDTGMSTTKANSVRVDLIVKNESELLNANTARTYWSGEMFRDYFEQLSDDDYTFRFTATYSNGVVKAHDVTITIRDSWREYYQFHRVL